MVAEPEEPSKSYEELLKELPSEYLQAERLAAVQSAETALQQLEAAREKVMATHAPCCRVLAQDACLARSASTLSNYECCGCCDVQGEAAKADAAAAKERLGEMKRRLAELRAQEREVSSEVSGILQDADAEERQVPSAKPCDDGCDLITKGMRIGDHHDEAHMWS